VGENCAKMSTKGNDEQRFTSSNEQAVGDLMFQKPQLESHFSAL